MRMWCVDTTKLCRKHLLGEHVELHMLAGCLRKNKNINGFLKLGLVDPTQIKTRHAQLVAEMQRRGYNHQSDLVVDDELLTKYRGNVSIEENEKELARRCKVCNFTDR